MASLSGLDRLRRRLDGRVASGRRSMVQGRYGGKERALSFLKTSPSDLSTVPSVYHDLGEGLQASRVTKGAPS